MTFRPRILLPLLALFPLLASAPAPSGAPAVPPPPAVSGKPGAPIALFNGKDTAGWVWHGQVATSKIEETWTVKEGVLHCAAVRTGAGGYIESEKVYKNFVLTVEYRHLTNANGGIFVCISGEPKVWPDALQIQGKFGAVGDLINQNTGLKKLTTDPARTKTVNKDVVAARIAPPSDKPAEKPLKEWNTLVITMENGKLGVVNNGVLVNTAAEITPDAGKIGIQAEAAEMEFRKIELAPLE